MSDKHQIENGNYTRISNIILESLVKMPFKGCELAVILYIIRKTYGYHKKQDEISLSQFCAGLDRSRPTIVKALKNLQLVKVVKLVRRGNSLKEGNVYSLNKYEQEWELVNTVKLVKSRASTSKHGFTDTSKHGLTRTSKDGFTHKRKERNIKETIQKKGEQLAVATHPVNGVAIISDKNTISPKQEARDFFDNDETRENIIRHLSEKYPEEIIRAEINKFVSYWSELNPTGTKQRWQMQPTFEIKRRLATWFEKVKNFNTKPAGRTRKIWRQQD